VEAYERKDFGQAVKFFSEAVQQSPGSIILQLHLANAQVHWFMQDSRDPDARARADAAESTLRNVLRQSPQNKLALWDLAMLYEYEGRHGDSERTLAILLRDNPNDSDALAASGTIATMQTYFDMQNEKRKANVPMKSAVRIEDENVRKSLRSEFGPRIQATEAALDRASQIDPHASQPLVMLNFIYRMKAQLAPTDHEFDDLVSKADAFVDRAVALNPGKPYPATTTAKLNPVEPPPPLPGPPPPPPPPKPPGSE
jgi:tetratricopeptide (TPR) repeat protein